MLRQIQIKKALEAVTNQIVPIGCVGLIENLCVLKPILVTLIQDLGSELAVAQATNIPISSLIDWGINQKPLEVKHKKLLFEFLKNQSNASRWKQKIEFKELINKLIIFMNINTHTADILEREAQQLLLQKQKLASDKTTASSDEVTPPPAKRTKLEDAPKPTSAPIATPQISDNPYYPYQNHIDWFWNAPTVIEFSDPFPRPLVHGLISQEAEIKEESSLETVPRYKP